MANPIKVKLQDKDGNTLHPETEWSAVQDRPSINNEDNNTVINPSGMIRMTGAEMAISVSGDITISTSDTKKTSVSLSDYPINWAALHNRPFHEVLKMPGGTMSSVQNAILGVYVTTHGSMGFTYYPAFAVVSAFNRVPGWTDVEGVIESTEDAYVNAAFEKIYRLNDDGKLEEVTDTSKFFGFLHC